MLLERLFDGAPNQTQMNKMPTCLAILDDAKLLSLLEIPFYIFSNLIHIQTLHSGKSAKNISLRGKILCLNSSYSSACLCTRGIFLFPYTGHTNSTKTRPSD